MQNTTAKSGKSQTRPEPSLLAAIKHRKLSTYAWGTSPFTNRLEKQAHATVLNWTTVAAAWYKSRPQESRTNRPVILRPK